MCTGLRMLGNTTGWKTNRKPCVWPEGGSSPGCARSCTTSQLLSAGAKHPPKIKTGPNLPAPLCFCHSTGINCRHLQPWVLFQSLAATLGKAEASRLKGFLGWIIFRWVFSFLIPSLLGRNGPWSPYTHPETLLAQTPHRPRYTPVISGRNDSLCAQHQISSGTGV